MESAGEAQSDMDVGEYCREIEAYLCRQNGGHLIRIVGPAFERVSRWAADGVPFGVVTEGIDRKLTRKRAVGGRPRPVRIEHCEADVLAAFDEWRRAVGVSTAAPAAAQETADDEPAPSSSRRRSLPRHLERAQVRLTNLLAKPEAWAGLHDAFGAALRELDGLGEVGATRGARREGVAARLSEIDGALLAASRAAAGELVPALTEDAERELRGFRSRMSAADYANAVDAAVARLLRRRLNLPSIVFEP